MTAYHTTKLKGQSFSEIINWHVAQVTFVAQLAFNFVPYPKSKFIVSI